MRLLALTKLGLCQLASAEFEKLGDLDRPELRDPTTNQSLVPFELRILWGTLPSFLKYPNVTLERITMLAVYCKKMQSRDSQEQLELWKQREVQSYLVLATHWIGMKDYSAAAHTMKLILTKVPDNIDILSSLGRLYLQMGDMTSATKMFDRLEELYKSDVTGEAIKTNKAFVLMAQGEWTQARDILQQVYQLNNSNLLVMNNLAVCEVYLGNLVKVCTVIVDLEFTPLIFYYNRPLKS
jgi:tetratricopeptide (TPR) repeat protein